ncbi:MAG: DUF2628 domain-containing protein [Alphaproteobacteria bacterium]
MFGPKLYTVHIDPEDPPPHGNPVFIREGFNIYAFLFVPFWALYNRLWLVAAVLIGLQVLFLGLAQEHIISHVSKNLLYFVIQVLIGFHANDLLRSRLQRKGFVLADVAAGENQLRAEQRFFERYLTAS